MELEADLYRMRMLQVSMATIILLQNTTKKNFKGFNSLRVLDRSILKSRAWER